MRPPLEKDALTSTKEDWKLNIFRFTRASRGRSIAATKEIAMNAKDIMTSKVITVTPGTLVSDVASLLFTCRISALPVVDDGRLAGIVSEADLLHRYEIGTDCAMGGDPWWMQLFSADRSPEEYVKSHARYARDIMTRDVATVAPDTPLAAIATMLERRRIRRVPVLEEGQLVGIVSRSDLVRALVSAKRAGVPADLATDDAIRALLLTELRRQAWWRKDFAQVTVEDGVVTFAGIIGSENERLAARVAAETVPGVRRVVDKRLAYRDLGSTV
ncbi:MAG TPA: CBS domain-containing protein [Burkholderiales bacterium]|nr:CBS domain-containing protein [Burkholderiales bacterium]